MTYTCPVMIAEVFFSRFEGILDTHIKVLIKTQLHIQTPYAIVAPAILCFIPSSRQLAVFNQIQFDESELKFHFHCSGQESEVSSGTAVCSGNNFQNSFLMCYH